MGCLPDDFWIRVCVGIVRRQEGEGGLGVRKVAPYRFLLAISLNHDEPPT